MIILVSSKISQTDIHASLGKPEYSYFFLMKDFLPLLERLGTVVMVSSLAEIDRLTLEYRASGEQVVCFSFSPPHQVPLQLSCATIVVFAWEFDSLPDTPWDGNPQNDWRYTFKHVQAAISTSREAAALVAQSMPLGYPVMACPAPVWNRFVDLSVEPGELEFAPRTFQFQGTVIDSPLLGLSADGLVRKPDPNIDPEPSAPEPEPQPQEEPPLRAEGRLQLAWLASRALIKDWWQEISESHRPDQEASVSCVSEEPVDQAVMQEPPVAVTPPAPFPVTVSGVVYVTVLNPADNRKNWVEIITAFCWAFKDVEDATLVVKMTHHDLEYYRIVLITLLSRLAPFKCRVLVLHGFLDDEQYRELIRATTFYVNASSAEGLCLPLMEFLSAGKPVIAPTHTAMADYMDEQLGFVIKCSPEPFCWPHDPARIFTTHRQRLNWQSLMEAFCQSHTLAHSSSNEYRQLAMNASSRMRDFASIDVLEKELREFTQRAIASTCSSAVSAMNGESKP